MFWFIALLLLAGAGFYFYQKMMDIEREIRAEQESAQPSSVVEPAADSATDDSVEPAAAGTEDDEMIDSPIVTPEVEQMTAKAEPVEDKAMSLEDELLAAVANLPGIKQTQLYESFADVSRKQLQTLIKELADEGRLKREKKGSTFLLYPG